MCPRLRWHTRHAPPQILETARVAARTAVALRDRFKNETDEERQKREDLERAHAQTRARSASEKRSATLKRQRKDSQKRGTDWIDERRGHHAFVGGPEHGGKLGEGQPAPSTKRSGRTYHETYEDIEGKTWPLSKDEWLHQCLLTHHPNAKLVDIELETVGGDGRQTATFSVTETAARYFKSKKYKRLSKAQRVAPIEQRFGGAALPVSSGYASLSNEANKKHIKTAVTTVPDLASWPFVDYRTDYILHLPPQKFCCGHVALQHATGMSLQALGIQPEPYGTQLSYKVLAKHLSNGAKLLGHTQQQFTLSTTELSAHEVFAPGNTGIYLMMTYHFHWEDIQDVNSSNVRDMKFINGVEPIPHYIVVNLDTHVLYLDPEASHSIGATKH